CCGGSRSRRARIQLGRSAGPVASEVLRNSRIRSSASVMGTPLGNRTEGGRRTWAWCPESSIVSVRSRGLQPVERRAPEQRPPPGSLALASRALWAAGPGLRDPAVWVTGPRSLGYGATQFGLRGHAVWVTGPRSLGY